MSFHWNLSSEDEFGDDGESEVQVGERSPSDFPEYSSSEDAADKSNAKDALATAEFAAVAARSTAPGHDYSDDDDVDWEDADDEQDVRHGQVGALTIDMDSKPSEVENVGSKKRIRMRKVFKFKSLDPWMRYLLMNLHRADLLSLLSRSVLMSRCCSDHLLLHVALSLIPPKISERIESTNYELNLPTLNQVRDFCTWYFDFVHQVEQRRRQQQAANLAAGAPRIKRQKGASFFSKKPEQMLYGDGTTSAEHLLDVCNYLSPTNDENPQLTPDESEVCMTRQDMVQLMISIARSLGWRARHVATLEPMKCDLDMDHPLLLSGFGNVFSAVQAIHDQDKKQPAKAKSMNNKASDDTFPVSQPDINSRMVWTEILCQPKTKGKSSKCRWVHVCPVNQLIDRPRMVEAFFRVHKFGGTVREKSTRTIAYALAVEHLPAETMFGGTYNIARLTDVTPRYANSWSTSLRLRDYGAPQETKSWWDDTLDKINYDARYQATWVCGDIFGPRRSLGASGISTREAIEVGGESSDDDSYDHHVDENAELVESAGHETIPTSKVGFKNHPIYVIESQLGIAEVLEPDAGRRVCGVFKGELVYRRSEVSTAMVAKKWMYEGRKVIDEEMGKPVRRVKARTKPTKIGFQPLGSYGVGYTNDGTDEARQREIEKVESEGKEDDGMKDLYAIWQTKPWSPDPVGPNDEIPVNEYKNVERALMNQGLVHLEAPRMSSVAKNLGIPYAPCLLGFEGHSGSRTPIIRGIVVHEHNGELLMEAYAEVESQAIQQAREIRQETNLRRWKKLIMGVVIKARVDREYGDDGTST